VATVAVEEELLFHCAIRLRHVTLMRWDDLRPTFRRRVRDLCFADGLGSLEMTMPAAEDAADPGQGQQRRPLQWISSKAGRSWGWWSNFTKLPGCKRCGNINTFALGLSQGLSSGWLMA
jgi:hypothetical protein